MFVICTEAIICLLLYNPHDCAFKSNDSEKSHCAEKIIAYSLYVPLHLSVILTCDCILRNTTEWLFLNLYYGEYELFPQIL